MESDSTFFDGSGCTGPAGQRGPCGGTELQVLRRVLDALGIALMRPELDKLLDRYGVTSAAASYHLHGEVYMDAAGNICVPVDWFVIRQAVDLLRHYCAGLMAVTPAEDHRHDAEHQCGAKGAV